MALDPNAIQTQQPVPQATPAQDDSNLPAPEEGADEATVAGEGVNLHRAFSKLNESIRELFDSLGVRQSANIPHVAGESAKDHIGAVGAVLPGIGGVTKNFLIATHTEHSKTGGETVLYPSGRLRETVIPPKTPEAKAAINACKHFVRLVDSLVGETPEVLKAKSQLALIGRNEGQGMSAWDLAAGLLSVPTPLIKMLARLHSTAKHKGEHHAGLTIPRE